MMRLFVFLTLLFVTAYPLRLATNFLVLQERGGGYRPANLSIYLNTNQMVFVEETSTNYFAGLQVPEATVDRLQKALSLHEKYTPGLRSYELESRPVGVLSNLDVFVQTNGTLFLTPVQATVSLGSFFYLPCIRLEIPQVDIRSTNGNDLSFSRPARQWLFLSSNIAMLKTVLGRDFRNRELAKDLQIKKQNFFDRLERLD